MPSWIRLAVPESSVIAWLDPEMVGVAPLMVKLPSIEIAPIPVIAPVAVMSQSLESIATVALLFPSVVAPVLDRVVNAPVDAVVAPIAVALIPVAVVLKLLEVNVNAFAPVEMLDAESPVRDIAPDTPVRLTAPVVMVKPFDAVRVLENLPAPVTSSAMPGLVTPIPTLPAK